MKLFDKFAGSVSDASGNSYAFIAAVILILLWAITGPLLGFSDTWQLIINTFTTLVTFLMVFLIQNSQNREQQGQKEREKQSLRDTNEIKNMLSDIVEVLNEGK